MKEGDSSFDVSSISISTAQSCLITAKTTLNQQEKIQSLVIAANIIDSTLKSCGVDREKIKKEKEKDL